MGGSETLHGKVLTEEFGVGSKARHFLEDLKIGKIGS